MKNNVVDFYEIYDYYYQPLVQRSFFKISLAIFIFIIFLIATYLFVRFLRKRKKEMSLLPWQWASEQINKLSPEKCLSKKDFKKFYFDLTFIIKKYFNKRYGYNIVDKTDDEVVLFLKEKNFDSDLLEKFKSLIKEALWIKFANQDALKIQAQKDLKIVKEIIQKTIPQQETKAK